MSSLQRTIRLSVSWYCSLGRKLFRVTPVTMSVGQAASLLSQVLLIFALFLPIKVLVLIGADSVPNYYPAYLQSLAKNQLMVLLSGVAVACYALHTVAELVVHICSISGASKLIERSSKLQLFESQQQFSQRIYSRFVRGLAAGLFFILINAVVIFIHPLLSIVVVTYLSVISLVVIRLHNRTPTVRYLFASHKNTVINLLSSMGFLVVFIFMIAHSIYFSALQAFTAVICLLLVRQGFSRLALMIQDVIDLRNQHRKINALFFHDQQWIVETTTDTQLLSGLFGEARRHQWMTDALASAGLGSVRILSSRWHQLGRLDIYAFESESEHAQRLMFKIFGTGSSSLAQQERVLLESMPDIPAPDFLGAVSVEGLACHIFRLADWRKLQPREAGAAVVEINRRLLCVEPAGWLIEQFARSHLFLERRLSVDTLVPLRLMADAAECLLLQRLDQMYEGIKQVLAQLPRQIVGVEISADTLLLSDAEGVCVSHWANWRMEPVGANWAVTERLKLEDAVAYAKEIRSSLASVATESIVLCAVMYAFERLCHRSHYQSALALVPEIIELFESIDPQLPFPRNDSICHA